ncbi:hypothetical protein EYF80_053403 [Liparis tanakae]|uniref:Uncharacterized protein n=1 Tax=Liparis tanakae TaxID=230148 RepID=A0A4Z2F5K5_9TELE|nr:hypothetical protein EYF80_053403 [Liparis tanakae]
MLPMEAFSSSTEGADATRSDGSGLILILNFFLWSSSPSDSSEEKKWGFLTVGGGAASRKETSPELNERGPGLVDEGASDSKSDAVAFVVHLGRVLKHKRRPSPY